MQSSGVARARIFDLASSRLASLTFVFLRLRRWVENRWLSVRIDFAGALVGFCAALFLLAKQDVDASLAGFSLSYSVTFVETVLWVVRMCKLIFPFWSDCARGRET